VDQLIPAFPPITIIAVDMTTMHDDRDSRQGITSGEAAARLLEYGPNELPERKHPGLLLIFLTQFRSPFIYVLLVAAIVSWGPGQTVNSIFVFAVLVINALIGSVQEYSAERAAAALRKMVPFRATAIRDGKTVMINMADIVPPVFNRLLVLAIPGAQAIHIGAMYTPGLRDVLQVKPVNVQQCTQLLVIALVLIVVDELHKLWHQRSSM